ncbi:ABC transporter ATP-binding protein, partial [Parvimonas micra]
MLQLKNISKSYKTGDLFQKALDNVSLNFRDSEFVAILGPSGSGKSTLLNIIGGLDKYEQGELLIDGISTKKYKNEDWDSYRNHTIGFVFQSYNLISHQTVLANVELALTISGISKAEREKRAIDVLDKVGLKSQMHKKPNQLSGGQMQRVAIARALVNNPSIVLADEPTGALDSETSVQVMELLKEVAKDRLVIMVTHNPKLANEYSTRIVELNDGKIISDSNPFIIENESDGVHKNFGKSSMSYLTSIALSFNNLKTKFKRTIMVAIAGSIGIIGIALILGLSNGVNQFIKDTEEETMISYPIEIDRSSFSLGKIFENSSKESTEGNVSEVRTIQKMLSAINKNDLSSLKEYFENDGKAVYDFSKAIEYKYDITPVIYTLNNEKYVKVNPNEAMKSMGLSSNNFLFSRKSMKTFYKLPKNEEIYKDKFTLKYGSWPSNENEAIVITNSKGALSDFIFYSLGLRDNDELSKMLKKFENREKTDVEEDNTSWKYEDIVGREFKVLSSSQLYSYDSKNKVYIENSADTSFVENLLKNNSQKLKIVGIASPNSDENASILQMGIWYRDELETSLRKISKESEVVKAQKESPNTNILTNTPFGEKIKQNLDFAKLFSIDQKKLFEAFKIDTSKINFNANSMKNIDFSKILNNVGNNDFLKNLDIKLNSDKLISLISDILKGYLDFSSKNPVTNYIELPNAISDYMKTDEAKNILKEFFGKMISKNSGTLITNEKITEIMKSIMSGYPEFARKNNYNDPSKFNQYLLEYFQTPEAKAKVSAETRNLLKSLGENLKLDNKDIAELANALSNGYLKYAKENNKPDPTKIKDSFNSYIATAEAKNMISSGVKDLINSSLSGNQNSSSKFLDGIIKNISSGIANSIKEALTSSMKNLPQAISIDPSKFSNAFSMNLKEEEIKSLITAMTNSNESSYENNMKLFNYVEDKDISKISIYPKDFEAKKSIISLLDSYNEMRKNNSEENKMITYTDLVGAILSSVTTIINVI